MSSKEESKEKKSEPGENITVRPEPAVINLGQEMEGMLTRMNAINQQLMMRKKDELADQPTPKALLLKRPGRGGQTWSYVEIFPMLRELKRRYPIHFFRVHKADIVHTDAVAIVELEIWENNMPVRQYPGTGTVAVPISTSTGKPVSTGDPISGAITLAMKKAMAYAGIYSDVYGDDANKYTIAAQELKDELLESVKGVFLDDVLYNQALKALEPEITIEEFLRIKRDIDGVIETTEIERRHEET